MDIDFTEVLEKLHSEIPVPKGCKEPLKDNYKPNHYHPINLDRWVKCNDENTCDNRSECMNCNRNKYNKKPEPTIDSLRIVVTVANPKIEYNSDSNVIRCVKVNEGCIFSIKKETLSDFIILLNDFNIELSTLNCEDGWIDILIKNKISLNNSVWRAIG